MKKILLFLLIFTLCLVGCQPVEPVEGNESSNNNQNNESAKNVEGSENSANNQNNETTEKTPATQITNEGQPQDESDDFLFVFKGKSGYFARGEAMSIEVNLINNTGATHTYDGASSYRASVKLFCLVNGEEYVLEHAPIADTDDAPGSYYDMEAGGSRSWGYYYNIPADAPLGEYTLVCQYQTTRTEFKGYFTLE
ncbi:MAG: hypothetical protein IJW49_09290 [Clostridia bacterium]|nr:hypothetical protein [Clostridia bacterium]